MTFDYTISLSNVFTALSMFVVAVGFFFKLHRCLEMRITRVEQRIGGAPDDPPLSQQIALVEQGTEQRHQENDRRLTDLQAGVNRLLAHNERFRRST
jgi:hypothetical protein